MKRKSKTGPSLRDKLSVNFMKAFEADFASNGVNVIEQLRLKAPDKYAAIATQLIASAEPPAGDFDQAKSMEDIGRGLLRQVGVLDENMTDAMIEAAIEAQDILVKKLELIAAMDVGLQIAEEYETRELRS
jgi:hypothetical protein